MKKYLLPLLVVIMTGCQKISIYDEDVITEHATKSITFNVTGDFGRPTFTRGTLQADGKDMTDLWIFDYVGDECVQIIHQEEDDEDFGEPTITMSYGEHHLYFVASRGVDPVVDDVEHNITWSAVRDTFWQAGSITIGTSTNAVQEVELVRKVAKMKVTINDEVPAGCSVLTMSPTTWYYGLDYITGTMTAESDNASMSVNVPASYAGTSGSLLASFFTISNSTEWTTDVTLTAKNASNEVIGSVSLNDVPLKANRSTNYSGSLFSGGQPFLITLDEAWLDDVVLTW
jgi:hypothetical protein